MIISLLVAVDEAGGIGYQNDLPWHLPADLRHFKTLTMGHHVVMGRKTYQSIGTPLPGREMIVLSRNPGYRAEGVQVVSSLPAALDLAKSRGEREVFIIGGSSVFEEALPLADQIYLTRVHAQVPADTFFPDLQENLWRVVSREFHPEDERNPYPHTYYRLIRKGQPPARH